LLTERRAVTLNRHERSYAILFDHRIRHQESRTEG
jgi:hypothetical protein